MIVAVHVLLRFHTAKETLVAEAISRLVKEEEGWIRRGPPILGEWPDFVMEPCRSIT